MQQNINLGKIVWICFSVSVWRHSYCGGTNSNISSWVLSPFVGSGVNGPQCRIGQDIQTLLITHVMPRPVTHAVNVVNMPMHSQLLISSVLSFLLSGTFQVPWELPFPTVITCWRKCVDKGNHQDEDAEEVLGHLFLCWQQLQWKHVQGMFMIQGWNWNNGSRTFAGVLHANSFLQ